MIRKLILLGVLVSTSAFSYSDYDESRYQREMLRQQQEQTRLLQEQAIQQKEAMAQQQLYHDNQQRQWAFRKRFK